MHDVLFNVLTTLHTNYTFKPTKINIVPQL